MRCLRNRIEHKSISQSQIEVARGRDQTSIFMGKKREGLIALLLVEILHDLATLQNLVEFGIGSSHFLLT